MNHVEFIVSCRPSWDSEEDNEKKSRGCVVQYQRSQIRVLTAFMAVASDSSASSPEHFLGPEWLVDVTRLVQSSLTVGDPSIAQLHRETVLSGKAPGFTTVQVQRPVSINLVFTEIPSTEIKLLNLHQNTSKSIYKSWQTLFIQCFNQSSLMILAFTHTLPADCILMCHDCIVPHSGDVPPVGLGPGREDGACAG